MATAYLTWWLSSLGAAAAWFLFLNVLVGAIAVTSRAQQKRRCAASGRRFCRSASSMVLDRLRSFFVLHPTTAQEEEWRWHGGSESDMTAECVPDEPAVETTPPSQSESAEGDTEEAEQKAAVTDDTHALCRQSDAQESLSPRQPPTVAVATTSEKATSGAVPPRPRQEEEEPATAAGFAKLTERCRGPHDAHAVEVEGKAELNARAERFIRQFRHDLRLQRLNSILRHTGRKLGPAAGPPVV